MEEQLITFETAKLAKEKGFKSATSRQYNSKGEDYHPLSIGIQDEEYLKRFPAPTQSLLQKWLREKHGIHIEIIPNKNKWHTVMYPLVCIDDVGHFGDWDTYEQALEEGLYEALK